MKTILLGLSLLMAGNLVAAQEPPAVPTPDAPPVPRIACDEPVYNFGEADNSGDVEHTFVVKNTGTLTLLINNVRPTCGCTVANISQKEIPPGGQADITTKLSLRGRQGSQHKVIRVESNDPMTPTFELALQGTATMQVEVRPNQVFFGRLTPETVVTTQVEVISRKQPPTRINTAESNAPFYICTVQPSDDPATTRIQIVTKPPLPEGQVRAVLNLATDNPGMPLITVPISAFVVKEVAP